MIRTKARTIIVKSPPSVLETALMLPANRSTRLFPWPALKQRSGSARRRVNRLWWTLRKTPRVVWITSRAQFKADSVLMTQTFVASVMILVRQVVSLPLSMLPMTGWTTQAFSSVVSVSIVVSRLMMLSTTPRWFRQLTK